MENFRDCFINSSQTILDAMKIINNTNAKIGLVVDENDCLLGVVTDGDIRRGLLRGITLSHPVNSIMFSTPTVASQKDSDTKIKKILKDKEILQIPIVDNHNKVVGLKYFNELTSEVLKDNYVLIMAGGFGKRLGDLTKETPKPMLDVGGKPMLERIIEGFKEYGFSKFYLSVFFKAEVIKNYFGDGSAFGVTIEYLEEREALGTAGPLQFLKNATSPILMINGDILTKTNFEYLLNYHKEQNSDLTICGTEYVNHIPYGVIQLCGTHVQKILEKPTQKHYINTGIYVIEPKTLVNINDHEKIDMNVFIERLLQKNKTVSMFPLHEYWLDIGLVEQFEQAQIASKELF